MEIKFYNTYSHSKEIFKPIDENNVRIYVCGPTVYDRIHLGNARPLIVFDLLVKFLRLHYPKVTYVRNITDVDDKIIDRANKLGISSSELTKEMIEQFHSDTKLLGLDDPDFEPKATDNIAEIISFIKTILANGFGYVVDGHVLFDTTKLDGYGSFANQKSTISGARVEVASYKKHPADFVLWKPAKDNELMKWESPWSIGRPGWHIECSVMSSRYLGEEFDIHGGGIDLVFPHHQNEIAQSMAVHHKCPARYWIHNGFLMLNNEKISKSAGNVINLDYLLKLDNKYSSSILKLLMLMTHYRKPLSFSDAKVTEARNILDGWTKTAEKVNNEDVSNNNFPEEFILSLADDLNTPRAISIINQTKDPLLVRNMINFLGLSKKKDNSVELLEEESLLIQQRNQARKNKDFHTADEIRDKLIKLGIQVIDHSDGVSQFIKKGK